ncbi:MAG TPA: hypothetical protein VGA02_02710 [Gemmatimonadales bacterium]
MVRRHRCAAAAVSGLLLLGASDLRGQPPLLTVPIDSGRLVRVHVSAGQPREGRLLRPFGPDNARLVFCPYPAAPCRTFDRAVTLSATEAVRLEIRTGSRWKRGVAIAAPIGFALGVLAATMNNGFCEGQGCRISEPAFGLLGAVSIGAWGALFGSQAVVWGPAP